MLLWHGSRKVVKQPSFGFGNPRNDYGLGFYCTQDCSLAQEWACTRRDIDGFANCYELDTQDLVTLDFSSQSVHHWLATLIENRTFRITSPIADEGARFLLDRYRIDLSSCDVIRGYRADDSNFAFAQAFLNNSISVDELARALKLMNLGEQVVVKSQRAFSRIKFVEACLVRACDFFPIRIDREVRAREECRAMVHGYDREGLYLLDLLKDGGC